MAFTFNNITYSNIYYVDPSLASNGLGTKVSPYNTLPDLTSISPNTAIVIRRTPIEVPPIPFNAGTVVTADNVMLVGAPKPVDPLYYFIPSISGNIWGTELHQYATIAISGSSTASGIQFSGAKPYVENLSFTQTVSGNGEGGQSGGSSAIVTLSNPSGYGCTLRSCMISTPGSYNDTVYNYAYRYGLLIGAGGGNGDNSIIDNCYISAPTQALFYTTSMNNYSLLNTTIKSWHPISQPCLQGQYAGAGKMYGCNFYCRTGGPIVGSYIPNSEVIYCNFYCDNHQSGAMVNLYYLCKLISCNFSTVYTGNAARQFISYSGGGLFTQNCSFYSHNDASIGGQNIVLNGSPFEVYGCTFNADALLANATTSITQWSGNTIISGSPLVSFPLYMPNVYAHLYGSTTSNPSVGNNSTLYIGSMSLANQSLANRQLNIYDTSMMFINNLDISLGIGSSYNYLNFNGTETSALYVQNEVTAGNWTARSLRTYMNTSNTARTGGKNYSLKCQSFIAPTNPLSPPYIWIAPQPFGGIPVAIGTTGSVKLTIYFAHKLYGIDPSLFNIVLQASIPAAPTGPAQSLISSKTCGVILPDSSTWVNDTGLTVKKLEVHFNMLQAGTVYCSIGFFYYDVSYPSGYVVIDPGIIASVS